VAFQLTNILRDIREDAERGRIYLPAEDICRFGVTEEDLRAGRRTLLAPARAHRTQQLRRLSSPRAADAVGKVVDRVAGAGRVKALRFSRRLSRCHKALIELGSTVAFAEAE
jgi:phytoene/squalene synthetase